MVFRFLRWLCRGFGLWLLGVAGAWLLMALILLVTIPGLAAEIGVPGVIAGSIAVVAGFSLYATFGSG